MAWLIDTLLFAFTLPCLTNTENQLYLHFHYGLTTIVNYNITLNFPLFSENKAQFFTCYLEDGKCIFCAPNLVDEINCVTGIYAPWQKNWIVAKSCCKIWLLNRQGEVLRQYPVVKSYPDWRYGVATRQPFRRDGSLNFLVKDTLTEELKLLTLTRKHERWIPLHFIHCKKSSPITQTTMFIDTLSEIERIYIKPGFCDSLYVYEPLTGQVQRFWIFPSYRLIMVDSNFVYGFYKDYWEVFDLNEKKQKRKRKKEVKRYVIVHDKHTGEFLGAIPIPSAKHWVFIGYNWYESTIYFVARKKKPALSLQMQVYCLSVSPKYPK